tara:strand:+ start:171 stop:419 length:249 start_codon:yes stop_codon:yes gene_type:complete
MLGEVLVLTTRIVSLLLAEVKAVEVMESTHQPIAVTAILAQQILEVVEVLAQSIITLAEQAVLELLLSELLQRPHQLLDLPL